MEEIRRALEAADPEERRRAVGRLLDAPSGARVPLLLRALGDADWRVRKEAARLAAELAPAADVLEGLVRVLAPDDNVGLRNAAVEALGAFGTAAVSALRATVSTLDADGRKLVAEALGRSAEPAALDVLDTLIGDSDANVRAAAIEAVGAVGSTAPEQAASVLKRCLGSAERFEVLSALEGLNRLAILVEWPLLERLIDDSVLSRAAWWAAGQAGHAEAASRLVRAVDETRGGGLSTALAAIAALILSGDTGLGAARSALTALSYERRRALLEQARDPDNPSDRRNALVVLGAIGTTDAADAAIEALGDDRVAAEADAALTMLGPAAILALATRARAGPDDERAACIELLSRLADAQTIATARQAVHDAVHSESLDVVSAGLTALARVGDENSMRLAAGWLRRDASPAVRHAAAAALSACAKRHPEAARVLARRCAPDGPDAAIAAVTIQSVGPPVFGSVPEDIEFLGVAVSNVSVAVRRAVIDALASVASSSAVDAISFALADEAVEVQHAAARALGRVRGEDGAAVGVERLFDVVRKGADESLTVVAVEALGDTGDVKALDVLRPLARSGTPMRAVAAVEAIGRLRVVGRFEALLEPLMHPEPEVVKAALRAMSADEDPRVEAHLGACLDHPAWDVRRLAADLLGQRVGDAPKRLLRLRLTSEAEPLVQEALQRSLAQLEEVLMSRRTVPPPPGGSRE